MSGNKILSVHHLQPITHYNSMGDKFYFEKLDVYNESVEFVSGIYKTTSDFPKMNYMGSLAS